MNIAVVSPVFPPYKGGMGAVAKQEADLVFERGHRVTVLTPSNLRPWFSIGNAAFVPSIVKRVRGFDLMHLHYPFYGGDIFVLLAACIWRIPYILTFHMRAEAKDWRNIVFILYRRVFEWAILKASRAVCVSSLDYAKFLGITHKNIVEIPFGVDEQIFSPGEEKKDVTPRLIFVGGMDKAHEFKGIEVLLEALTYISQDVPWRATLVGDGELRPQFERYAKDHDLDHRITFSGSLPFADLPKAYQDADLHVLASTSSAEAFGLVTLEAAATGIPSIVTNLPGVRTIVIPEKTGLVVPPRNARALAEAIERLLRDTPLRLKLGAAARNRVLERYTKDAEAKALIAAYQQSLL